MKPLNHAARPPLPEKQRAVLEFLKSEVAAGRPFPSLAAIAAHMGWKEASALDCLGRLIWRGLVVRKTTYAMTVVNGYTRRQGTKTYELAPEVAP